MADYTNMGDAPWFSVREQIKSVAVNDGVTHIGNNTFIGCTSITTVTVGNFVQSIGDFAFAVCNLLTSVTISNSVETIGDYAFRECKALTTVTIGNSVQSVGQNAFFNCPALVNIFFLSTTWNITSIGSDAFSFGYSSAPVTASVHSPNNVANGQLDAYKGNYTTLNYVASVQNTYTINVNQSGYGSVSPTSVQIWEGVSVAIDGNRLVFTDGQTVTATPSPATA